MKVNILCIKMHNLSSSSNMKTFLIKKREKKKRQKVEGRGKASWKQRSRVDTRIVNQPFHFSQKRKYRGSFVVASLVVESTYQNDHEKLLWLNIISTNFNLLSWGITRTVIFSNDPVVLQTFVANLQTLYTSRICCKELNTQVFVIL